MTEINGYVGRWVIETNNGYVEGSMRVSGSDELKVFFTQDIHEATYRSLREAKVWAGNIISQSLCGILYVKLVPLEEEK